MVIKLSQEKETTTIRVSREVYKFILNKKEIGESLDDVLKKILNLPKGDNQ